MSVLTDDIGRTIGIPERPLAVSMNAVQDPSVTPLVATSGNVANASAVATLAATANKTTYITGFDINATGATAAAIVLAAVVATSTLSFPYAAPAGVTLQGPVLSVRFPAPIPASAVNTAITVTLPALGAGNTNAIVTAYGFQI